MNKKLPNVFAYKHTGIVNNNKEMYYSGEEINKRNLESDTDKSIKSIIIRKKINDLFNSENFVYKVNVVITTMDGDKECTLIAKNNDTLLTINNESISINEIIDIRKM